MNQENVDCSSCKVISVCTFLGIGGYLIHRGKTQTRVSKYTMFVIGTAIGGLGVGEIFNKSPFR